MKNSYLLFVLSIGTLLCSSSDAQKDKKPATHNEPAPTYQIEVDCSQTPKLKTWVEKELKPTLAKWYPIILADLPTNGFVPPQRYTITLEANGKGVAYTSGLHVVANAKWIESEVAKGPQNESLGALVHESVHVAQQYYNVKGDEHVPVWLREGIADYIRWWKYETAATRRPFTLRKPDGEKVSYKDGYHTTAAFLEYLAKNYDHEIVVKLNTSGRAGTYSDERFHEYTGKTLDELWGEFIEYMTHQLENSSK